MAENTSDEFYQIGRAAEAATSKVSIFQRTMMSSTQSMGSSLTELREQITQIEISTARASSLSAAAVSRTKKPQEEPQKEKKKKDEGDEFKVGDLIKGGTGLLKMAMDLQTTQVAFQQLTGSATTAKALIGSLQQMGTTTPFKSKDLMENAKALLDSGTSAANVVPILSLLGDVGKGNQEKLNGLTKAFGQIQESGKLTETSMKAMVDAGFNPLDEIARTSGLSMEKLKADLAAGKISVDQVTTSLISATGPGGQFFGAMQQQSDTAAGKWNQFNETMNMAGTTLGTALLPLATDFINNVLIPMGTALQMVAGWLAEHSGLIEGLAVVIGGALIGYKLWAIAQGAVNLVMSLNPAGLVVAGIVALISGIIYLWNTFSGFRGAIVGAWEWLKAFGTLIKDFVIDRIKGLITGMGGLAKALGYIFEGEWSKAWETGKQAVSDLTGITAAKNAYNNAGSLGKAFSKGFDDGVNMKPVSLKSLMPKTPAAPRMAQPADYSTLGNTPTRANTSNGLNTAQGKVEGITGGGARNIIINLQKLFDDININSSTVQQGVSDMEQIVTEALLRVLNSANAIE